MLALVRSAVASLGLLSVVTGIAYPMLVTGLAQVVFPRQAGGSLVLVAGRVVGSELVGQAFVDPRLFWSRPSATLSAPYDAAASGGSNLGPSNPALQDAVRARIETLVGAGGSGERVPVDLVTASGSGLDPHITPAAAFHQVRRVARARGLSETELWRRVEARIEGRSLGVLGEPRVNVLLLNLDLERSSGDEGPR
ncbi:MAG: potassium-transporting ATPase subunit KdpC [Deltaproteobacteria bacterium]|nr:potassium-transporting ATPase subunit KdpC [Deltaproteobacteria bacterium]